MRDEPSPEAGPERPALDDGRVAAIRVRLVQIGALLEAALAEERERRRIAAALHDRLGQALALSQIRLRTMRAELPASAAAKLDEVVDLLAGAAETTRALTFDLVPPLLHDLGPAAAIDWLVEQLAASHGLRVDVEGSDLPALDPEVAAVVFRVVRELLTHVAERVQGAHAGLVLSHGGDHVGVEVSDRGPRPRAGGRAPDVLAVREEIRACGGALELSTTESAATCIRVRVPVAAAAQGGPAR
jgi:signal transduction histidine kinase